MNGITDENITMTPWEDVKSVGEGYINDIDLQLYCEDLGKLRTTDWGVI